MTQADLRQFLVGGGVLQKYAVIDSGAAANTEFDCTGIKVGDVITKALLFQPPGAGSGKTIKADLLAEITIPSDGHVKCASTATNGSDEQVLVEWLTKDV